MLNDIHKIADHYGFESQSIILIEEVAELTQAITKYKRYSEEGLQSIRNMKSGAICRNLVEEIADVEIMLEQIKYLLNITDEDTSEIKSTKIERTLEFIKVGRHTKLDEVECILGIELEEPDEPDEEY